MKRRLLQLAVLLAALGRVCAGDFEDRLSKGFWVRDYYNEVIQKKDRNVFLDYVPVFKEKPFDFYEHLGYELYWYEELNRLGDVCHDFYSEPEYCLFLLRRPFAVEEITKLKDCCYRIVTRDIKIDSAFIAEAMYEGCDWSLLKDKSEIQLYVEFDGDYLFIYTDEAKTLLATYCMYEKNEYNSFLEAVKTNDFDGMEFTWPRHADGTCDYEEANGNAAATSENVRNEGTWTTLMYAARYSDKDKVEALLAAGAVVDAKDIRGRTALMLAAIYGSDDIAKLLLAAGADVNAKDDDDQTALIYAARCNSADVAEILLAAGADMNAKDNDGWTAFMYAAKNDSEDVAKLLIKSGADAPATVAEFVELVKELKPAPAVGKTATVTENLRLRTDDRTTAEVVATLAAGTRVKVEATGREDTIDGIASRWVRVAVLGGAQDRDGNAVAAGTEGWLFGGYLSAAEDVESQSGEADALPIALVAAGGAVLAILLAALLLAVRKRKGGE